MELVEAEVVFKDPDMRKLLLFNQQITSMLNTHSITFNL